MKEFWLDWLWENDRERFWEVQEAMQRPDLWDINWKEVVEGCSTLVIFGR